MQPVERSNPEGVDYGWVMQTTFVVTILVGAPIVAFLSTGVTLPTWEARVSFAVRVGAVIWFLTAVTVFAYAKRTNAGDGGSDPDAVDETAVDPDSPADADATDGDATDGNGPGTNARADGG